MSRDSMSQHCCWPFEPIYIAYLFWMFRSLALPVYFLSLSGLSKIVYKATLPYFLFFLFPFSCLIFSLYGYVA